MKHCGGQECFFAYSEIKIRKIGKNKFSRNRNSYNNYVIYSTAPPDSSFTTVKDKPHYNSKK